MNVDGLPSFATGSPAQGTISIRNDEMFGSPTPTPTDTFIPSVNEPKTISIRNDEMFGSPTDTFLLSVNDPNGHWVEFKLVDPTGQALASTALPSTLDLAKFTEATVEYRSEAGLVFGHITSLEVAAVPEPSPLAVLVLGGLGLAVARRKVRGWRPIG